MNRNKGFAGSFRCRLAKAARLETILRDQRGATALIFAVSAFGFFGLAGLAAEGGTWYLEKRHGQNAADAAAMAAVLQVAGDNAAGAVPGNDVAAAGTAVATSDNYTAGANAGTVTSVTVTPGRYSGGAFSAGQTPYNAALAQITRSPPRLFSGLFLAANPTIGETAMAAIVPNPNGVACSLALSGGLNFGGNTLVSVRNCTLASDNTGADSIHFNGASAQVSPGALIAAGGCSSGNAADQCNVPGNRFGFPCTPDPFGSPTCGAAASGLYALAMPPKAASAANCEALPAVGNVPVSMTYENSAKMICDANGGKQTWTVNAGASYNLSPGTYIFYNTSISMQGGTVQCTTCTPGGAGVTIILTGSPASKIGTLGISGNANVSLNAPAVNGFNAALNGVLFYMDKNAPDANGNGNTPVSLQGNGNVQLTGAMYFPSVTATDNGNITSAANCSELVAKAITFTGSSTQNVSGCGGVGTPTPQTYYLALLQ